MTETKANKAPKEASKLTLANLKFRDMKPRWAAINGLTLDSSLVYRRRTPNLGRP